MNLRKLWHHAYTLRGMVNQMKNYIFLKHKFGHIGNNVLIAEYMGANIEGYFPVKDDEQCISIKASFKEPISYVDSNNPIDKLKAISDYKREVRFINPKPTIQNCVICTGEGGFNMDMDLDGIDALITGEITERYYHLALEKDISIILLALEFLKAINSTIINITNNIKIANLNFVCFFICHAPFY